MSPASTADAPFGCAHTDAAGRCGRPSALIVTITRPDDQPRQAAACGLPHARLLAESHQELATRIAIAPTGDQLTCVDCALVVVFGPDATTLSDQGGQLRCRATATAHRIEHDCEGAGTLAYAGHYGAPGCGQAWDCAPYAADSGRGWAVGSTRPNGARTSSPRRTCE
jgi:hypothetical protein